MNAVWPACTVVWYSFLGTSFYSGICSIDASALTGLSSFLKKELIQFPKPEVCFYIFASFMSYLNCTLFFCFCFLLSFSYLLFLCFSSMLSRLLTSLEWAGKFWSSSNNDENSSCRIGYDLSFNGDPCSNNREWQFEFPSILANSLLPSTSSCWELLLLDCFWPYKNYCSIVYCSCNIFFISGSWLTLSYRSSFVSSKGACITWFCT